MASSTSDGAAAPEYVVVPPKQEHTATIILIHGLGDTGNGGMSVLANMFSSDHELQHIKWILPHAPKRSVSANQGRIMPAWYNIFSFTDPSEDEGDVQQSARGFNALIEAELAAGIPIDRIVLGGFSQGGSMTAYTGLTTEHKLAGLFILSGRLLLKNKWKSLPFSQHVKELPIFWGHGLDDPIVKYQSGVDSANFLKSELGIQEVDDSAVAAGEKPVGLSFHSYEGLPHTIGEQEMEDLKKWLKAVIPRVASDSH
ncbi:Phospholipase/carboxylesterase [Panus rudis PR-1116 ss-1]|nr:Phospholipase/carboxylesterase [Panus rudis PR-1116 ss-1]